MRKRDIVASSYGSFSQRGPRSRNEDAVYADDTLLVVCDGVGGARFGDAMATAAVNAYVRSAEQGLLPRDALGRANDAVLTVKSLTSSADSGSTIVAAQIVDGYLEVVWVGDSVAYLVRGGTASMATDPQGDGHGLLSAGLGYSPAIEPRHVSIGLEDGDCIILCSDGMWCGVSAEEVASLTRDAGGNAPKAARLLCELGASREMDNATAAVMFIQKRG